jgi:hypothetical protein
VDQSAQESVSRGPFSDEIQRTPGVAGGVTAERLYAMPLAAQALLLQRSAGNRSTTAWIARLQRAPVIGSGAVGEVRPALPLPELSSDQEAIAYAKRFAASAGKGSLTDETRRLFRYIVRTRAPDDWLRLGAEWTFDDYPYQSFTFSVMPLRHGSGFLLGIGSAFITRIAAADLDGIARDLRDTLTELNKRDPHLSGKQPAVPGLGALETDDIAARIRAHDPQGALDLLLRAKIQVLQIDPALLTGGAMRYDPDVLAEDAVTSMGSWNYITNRADPATVRVGPSAFSSVAYLYSVVMHEYQHVLQHQSLARQQREQSLRDQGLKTGGEVEAYAWELLHAAESGLKDLPEKVGRVWSELNSEFWELDAVEQARVRPQAREARKAAEALVRGTTVSLVPFSRPPP